MGKNIEVAIPLARPEKKTNTKSLVIFFISTILYTGIAIYAFSNYNPIKIKNELARKRFINNGDFFNFETITSLFTNPIIEVFTAFCNYLQSLGWYISIFLAVLLSTSVLCILAIQKISRALIIIITTLECIGFAGVTVTFISFYLSRGKYDDILSVLMFYAFFLSIIYLNLYAIYRVGAKLIREVIKESCRAIRASPFLILWTFLSNILSFGVMILTYNVFITLRMINSTDPSQYHLEILRYINIFIGMWIISFIFVVNRIVCSKTFSTWFYTTSKADFTDRTTVDSIIITIRYYLGTAAYASSCVSMSEAALTMIKTVAIKPKDTRYNIFVNFGCVINTYLTLPNGSCIITAMQGTNFKKSSYTACHTYFNNCLHLYAINKGFWCCIVGSSILLFLACQFIINAFIVIVVVNVNAANTYTVSNENIYTLAVFTMFSMITTTLILEAAVSTITICIFKELEYEKRNLTRPNFLNDELKDLMLPENSYKKIHLISV